MLWLYWRRSRLVISVAAAVLGAMAGLALVAASLAGGDALTAQPAAMRRPAAVQPQVAVPSAGDPRVRLGLQLMSAAADACQSVSYRGVQIVAWTSPGVSSSYLIDVWHRSGEPELAQSDGDADDRTSSGRLPGGSSGAGVVGVLSISPSMLTLLRANYVVEYAGPGTSSDRPAQIIAVRRHDGTLAAQYWLDRGTNLPLRREMFDESGRRVSEGAFIDLELGLGAMGTMPPAEGRAWDTYIPSRAGAGLEADQRADPLAARRRLAGAADPRRQYDAGQRVQDRDRVWPGA